ncbi:nuclear transport factor 2 family protein [Sedimentibacter sp. zth1]|uniref:nuclear transport factor 2 family protein n=1 Tax=Sedimentibacter sp. zth1 TaxID=2816908 RepID=UPI001A92AB48|nr:nuclear transport factor 2 family protein [Sedimentibacter sp. zth1]QSX05109.1 nuclear transport factor 2 family protein [Sedimentibacter sp. zth1]
MKLGKYDDIKNVLIKFQQGYKERNLENVDSFIEELFLDMDDISVLGTAIGEIFLGKYDVRELIEGDWKYWGDLNIDCENMRISTEGEVAWFSTSGYVKHVFEDSEERDNRYLEFIKNSFNNQELTCKQKLTFINWVLALTYHKRDESKREYLWPLCLSGVLVKYEDNWKIKHLHFSMSKANFPDERFENSNECIERYNEQKASISRENVISKDMEKFLNDFENECMCKKQISNDLVGKYFGIESLPYVIGPDNQFYNGTDMIREFFNESNINNIAINMEQTVVSKSGKITWIMANGILKQKFTEEELVECCMEELGNLFESNLASKEKLFSIQRSIAYVLKECSSGYNYTCPIRMTAVILNKEDRLVFNSIHFSFPFYWLLEGKVDGIKL